MVDSTERRRAMLERVFREDGDRLWGYLVSLVGDRHRAEDILQEVFLKTLAAQVDFPDETAARAYVFRSARNATIDVLRRRAVRAETSLVVDPPAPERRDDDEETLLRLRGAVGELSPEERDVLAMKYDGQMTYAQIAETRDEPLGTVLARAHRAVRKVGRIMRRKEHRDDETV